MCPCEVETDIEARDLRAVKRSGWTVVLRKCHALRKILNQSVTVRMTRHGFPPLPLHSARAVMSRWGASGGVDRVIVAVEFARASGVEGYRLDRLVAGRAEAGQHLEDLVLPDVDGDREGDSRLPPVRAVAGLADAVGGRGEAVVRDTLHVV